jgi:hypothetical protein
MSHFNYKYDYSKKLELGFIISLSILIIFFYFSSDFQMTISEVQQHKYPQLIIIDVPPTRQNKPQIPKPVKPIIPIASEEIDFLSDVIIKSDSSSRIAFDEIGTIPKNASDLPVQPRQILEVLPKNVAKEVKGEIVFSLLIGWDGRVKNQKLISNTTNCSDCLTSVLAAVTKSQWQPVKFQGKKTEYWIRKAYIFE